MTSPQFTSAPCTNCNGKKYNSRCFDEVGSDDFGGEGYAKRGQIENIPCSKCQKGESVKTTIHKNMNIPEYIFDHRRNAEIRRKQDPMQNRYCQDVDTLTDIIVEELKAKEELKEQNTRYYEALVDFADRERLGGITKIPGHSATEAISPSLCPCGKEAGDYGVCGRPECQ